MSVKAVIPIHLMHHIYQLQSQCFIYFSKLGERRYNNNFIYNIKKLMHGGVGPEGDNRP
jgi:hypothetical protein